MGIVYHGSKHSGLTHFEPHKSTHGSYVYGTTEKVLALHFSGRSGDDMVYSLGHFDNERDEPYEIVENIPGAFEKMYANSSSIYTFSDETFKDIHTGFNEVVSEQAVEPLSEEYIENVYDAMMQLAAEGKIKMYRYPDKPKSIEKELSDFTNLLRHYKEAFGKQLSKHDFDRLVYLHPENLNEANKYLTELGIDYQYKPEDLIALFEERIERQLSDSEHEQYVESAYTSMCNTYPELKDALDLRLQSYYERKPEEVEKVEGRHL